MFDWVLNTPLGLVQTSPPSSYLAKAEEIIQKVFTHRILMLNPPFFYQKQQEIIKVNYSLNHVLSKVSE